MTSKKKEESLPAENLLSNIPELQYKIKKQPELYVNEVIACINKFKEEFEKVKLTPGSKNESFIEISLLLSHIAEYYRQDLEFFHVYLIDLLEKYAEIMNPFLRHKMVICLILLRSKNLLPPIKSITLFMKLFQIKHKEMRKIMISHIINDIKRINVHHKNQAINKQIQNLVFEILKNNADNSAKRSIHIMIQLYKKNIWNDSKTVNIIASGCLNPYYKVKLISCNFLIETTELYMESSDEEDDNIVQATEKKGAKQTKARIHRLEREKKKAQKKMRRREHSHKGANFFPIDLINDPQDFVEKLFSVLKKTTERFEVKVALMSVISRLIGRHSLLLMSYYSFLQKYCFPHQREIGKILAFLAEACHDLVPIEELKPILKHIIDNFVNDRCTDEKICMGINVVREMCIKNNLIMDDFQLNYLAEYIEYKNRNVSSAAKSIINLFREINPTLLQKKYRGRRVDDNTSKVQNVGEPKVENKLYGADLLGTTEEGIPIYCDKVLDESDFRRIRLLQRRKKEEEENLKNQNENSVEEESEDGDENEENDEEELEIEEGDEEMEEDDDEDDEDFEENDEEEEEEEGNNKNVEEDDGMDEELSEEENPHGFVSESKITFFKKRGKEAKLEQKILLKNTIKEKKHHGPKEKKGGTTNQEKLKRKPLSMLRFKKNREKNRVVDTVKRKIKKIKIQLGHVRSGKQAARLKKKRMG